jgi:hypothetical protein
VTKPFKDRRREPRVHLCVAVIVTGTDANEEVFSLTTRTIDLSPSGAGVLMDRFLPEDAVVKITATGYEFTTWAVVRSTRVDRDTNMPIVGFEYLDGVTNPIVDFYWYKAKAVGEHRAERADPPQHASAI